jgi:hypothetical protein
MNMRKKLLTVSFMIMALIYTTATPPVSAQDCKTPGPFREAMKQLTSECKKLGSFSDLVGCVTSAPLYAKIIGIYNGIVGDGPLKIGPRNLNFNQTEQGSLKIPGDRVFITGPSDRATVTLSIKKRGGQGGAKVSICKVDGNGNVALLDTHTFQPDDPDGKEYKKTFSGVLAHGFTTFMDGQGGGVLRRFDFDIRLSK